MEDQSHSMEHKHDLSIISSLSNIAFQYKYLMYKVSNDSSTNTHTIIDDAFFVYNSNLENCIVTNIGEIMVCRKIQLKAYILHLKA